MCAAAGCETGLALSRVMRHDGDIPSQVVTYDQQLFSFTNQRIAVLIASTLNVRKTLRSCSNPSSI